MSSVAHRGRCHATGLPSRTGPAGRPTKASLRSAHTEPQDGLRKSTWPMALWGFRLLCRPPGWRIEIWRTSTSRPGCSIRLDGTRIIDLGRLRSGQVHLPGGSADWLPLPIGWHRGAVQRQAGAELRSDSRRFERAHLPLPARVCRRSAPAVLTPNGLALDHRRACVLSQTGPGVGFDVPMTAVAGDIGAYHGSAPVMASLAGPTLGSPRRRRGLPAPSRPGWAAIWLN